MGVPLTVLEFVSSTHIVTYTCSFSLLAFFPGSSQSLIYSSHIRLLLLTSSLRYLAFQFPRFLYFLLLNSFPSFSLFDSGRPFSFPVLSIFASVSFLYSYSFPYFCITRDHLSRFRYHSSTFSSHPLPFFLTPHSSFLESLPLHLFVTLPFITFSTVPSPFL